MTLTTWVQTCGNIWPGQQREQREQQTILYGDHKILLWLRTTEEGAKACFCPFVFSGHATAPIPPLLSRQALQFPIRVRFKIPPLSDVVTWPLTGLDQPHSFHVLNC